MRPALALLTIAAFLPGAAPAAPAPLLAEEQVAIAVHDAAIGSVVQVDVDWQAKDGSASPEFEQFFGKIMPVQSPRPPHRDHVAGTGVVWDAAGHVVAMIEMAGKTDARIALTFSDGSRRSARLVGTDRALNVSVLQIDGAPSGLHPITLGSSAGLRVGQQVFALGSAWGRGIVMMQGMLGATSADFDNTGRTSLLVNSPVNPGNTGGPVLDTSGQVIGLIQGMYTNNGYAGLAMAMPSDTLAWVVPRLIADGRVARGQLGLTIVDSKRDSDQAALPEGLPGGVAVATVSAGGPAERAGLRARAGDAVDVITGIDGSPVRGFPDLRAVLDRLRPGQTCTLTVWRAGKTISVPVTLGAEKAD